MADTTRDRLQLIDDVAARMTAGVVPVDLRARVLDRIGDRPLTLWWHPLKLAALLAVPVLAIAGAVVFRTSSVVDPPVASAPPLASTVARVAPETVQPVTQQKIERARRPRAAAVRPPSAIEVAWQERAIPALPSIDAIAIGAIQPNALSIPQLELKPLTTAPLGVTPIEGGGGK